MLIPVAGLACWFAVGRVLGWLSARAILDRPNARSAHTVPVPRGGGIGLMAALVPALSVLWVSQAGGDWRHLAVIAAVAILALISWVDDTRSLSAWPRLAAHCLAATIAVLALPSQALVAQGLLPIWADRLLAGLAIVYFINIFNFMDGIDGISGVETLTIGLGATLIAVLGTSALYSPVEGLILAAVATGWLIWNWQPARLFLGDVGSVPLGFLLAWLLIRMAAEGAWIAALALPAYYLADASLTLAHRTMRGQKPWNAHREHAYQRAHQRGLSHGQVCLLIVACNLCLLALVMAGTWVHWSIAVIGAPLVACGFTIYFRAGALPMARRLKDERS